MNSKIIITTVFLLIVSVLLSQPAGGGPGAPTPLGFTEVLLAGGAILAYRRHQKSQKS